MEFLDVIRSRRAVRDFKPDPLAPQILRRVIDAAIQAPSAMNDQPWRFSVVTDAAMLERMSAAAKRHLLGCLHVLPKPDHFRDLFSDPQLHLFHRAPALIVISADSENPWVSEDCALAAENLMLAATEMRLGSCWVGFAQAWLNALEGRQMLGIPLSHRVVAPIVLGIPKASPPAVPRRAPDIVWVGEDQLHAARNATVMPARAGISPQ
jgi:nitroreductase